MKSVRIVVNGEPVEATVEARLSLADFLREHCGLTGTHLGCEHGVCGSCTVVMNGAPVRSCITLAATADGADIRSIEGYDDDPLMGLIRQCFNEEHAVQCGFCTPGLLAVAYDIANRLPTATREEIKTALSGNLCRCTGYIGAVNAIERVIHSRAGGP